ncbi:hypothetical protein CQW23_22399 [Capsicum baccatum]|uniref:Ubiquitin-like protease family profile domain-containing protein n=1 Tax=Capsicum baccatum TaxID=33114 RepID=A0A2G2W0R9_CAPBA|nr:hypothetical protein CQW23_22399 [Capsicum baccatum]
MMLEVKGSSSSGIVIYANGTYLNFTPRKFAIVTGLNCVSNRNYTERQLFLAFTEKVCGENNDEDAEKFAILYFLHSFVLSNVETVVIPRLHFDLVVFKNIKPAQAELTKFQIPQKDVIEDECLVDSDDDFLIQLQYENKDPEVQQMDYAGAKTSPQRFSPNVDQNLGENQDGTKLRIRRLYKFMESLYMMKFGSAAINIKEKHHWVLAVLSFSDRCIFLYGSYESSGHHSVVLAEIEKLGEIIPLCLQSCDFYDKKGIDLQNHPRYKDKDSSNMFDILFEENFPPQPSGSLDCRIYMVTYTECLSYGHKIISTKFDPNALRTRYAALLWDYNIRKQEANSHSDIEAPSRPARQSIITSVTEVVDV